MADQTPEEDRAKQNRADSKAAGIYLYSRSGAAIIELLTLVFVARVYDTLGVAYVMAILVIYQSAISLGSLGLAEAVFYFFGRTPERAGAIVRQTSGLLLAAAIPVTGAVIVAGYVMSDHDLQLVPALPFLALLLLMELPTQPAVNQLLAGGHATMASVLFVGFSVLRTGAILIPAVTGWPFTAIPITMAGLGLLRLAAHVVILRVYYPLAEGERWLRWRELRAILAFALPAGLAATVGKINPQVDKYVVQIVLGTRDFAHYGIASWELPLIALIPFAIGAVMQVRYVRLYAAERRDELRALWYQTAQKTMLAVIPLAVLVIVVADELIVVIFGPEWVAAATPFRIFTLVLLHRVAAYGPMLQAVGRTRVLVVTSSLILGTNLVLTVPLTYLLGPAGAATATVVANLPAWLVCLHVIGRAWGGGVRDALPWRYYGGVLALGIAVGAATWGLLHVIGVVAGLRIAVGAVFYTAVYATIGRATGLISASDLAFFLRWVSFGLIK